MLRKIKLSGIFGRENSVIGNLYSCIKIASERRKEEVIFHCSSKWCHGIATMPPRKLRQFIPLKLSTEQNAVHVCFFLNVFIDNLLHYRVILHVLVFLY
jgi:hypothetical protein